MLPDHVLWLNYGVRYVSDVYQGNAVKSFQQPKDDFGLWNTMHFRYLQLRHVLQTQFPYALLTMESLDIVDIITGQDPHKLTSIFYSSLLRPQVVIQAYKLKERWVGDVGELEDDEWEEALDTCKKVSTKTRGEQQLRQEAEQPRTPRPRQPDWAISPSPSPASLLELPSPVSEREQPSSVSSAGPSSVAPLDEPSPGLDVEEEEQVELHTPQSESDDLVVVGEAAEPFSADSAQRLIGDIMAWNGQIDQMENQILNIQRELVTMRQGMKNMIDVLGRI
ncbi:uncharacterized protein LOC143925706 [Lithobates pipiens]